MLILLSLGIRRRIPRAISPSINEHDIGADQTSTVNEDTGIY